MANSQSCFVLISVLSFLAFFVTDARAETVPNPKLSSRNVEAPFCYVHEGRRRWPVLEGKIPPDTTINLVAKQGQTLLAEGTTLDFSGLSVSLSRDGFLDVASSPNAGRPTFQLGISLQPASGPAILQTLTVRPAPPNRPLSYYADFGDDIIRIFMDNATGRYGPIEKSGFDQYFRRLQAQGIQRLIIWLTPFPTMADPSNYAAKDWNRYAEQARAILTCEKLSAVLSKKKGSTAWGWVQQLMALRLMRNFGPMVAQSAHEHGIRLTVSFRPFEAALTKYYEVPAFDEDGTYLWGFLPLASPVVNYHADQVCFAHYRTILKDMGKLDEATLTEIEVKGIQDGAGFLERWNTQKDNLKIVASGFPPLQQDSFVLYRRKNGGFQLRPYHEIRDRVESQLHVVTDYKLKLKDGKLRITGLRIPDHYRYLILTNPTKAKEAIQFSTRDPITLKSKAGNPLGRNNIYWVLNGTEEQQTRTRMGGITGSGDYYTEFKATQASIGFVFNGPDQRTLIEDALVIDCGAPYSVEMIDFQQPAARRFAVAQLKSLLAYPAFDEIFINTRSHTQLAGSIGDGVLGVQPIARYRAEKKNYRATGIDRAYAPRAVAKEGHLQDVEKITTGQPGEWTGPCQSADSPYDWRYARNRAVASGVRMLLQDLEQTFPKTRIRVVIPPSEKVIHAVKNELDKMKRPDGKIYGRDYYRFLWGTLNYIPVIGEGMAMVDLTGLRTEPVPLGIRGTPDWGPLRLFVTECLADMIDNHGSKFRGPRSFFYEAQETLRAKDRKLSRQQREEIICDLLSHQNEINEVILYEAADWTYYLPMSDPDLCGHGFLDRCKSISDHQK